MATMRRPAYFKTVACMAAWFMMTMTVLGQAGEIHADGTLSKQAELDRVELMRASSLFNAVGVAGERVKDVVQVQQSEAIADARIADKVKTAVRRDPEVRTVDVVVLVSGGVVTLSGTVSTSHQRARAEQLASEVEGVTAVVNHIAVSNVRP